MKIKDENHEVFDDNVEIMNAMKQYTRTQERFDPEAVNVETKNTQMITFISRMENGEIDLSPDFQRRQDVWKKEQQSRLIESMMLNIPLPAFYVDASDINNWIVIDGLQRLNTIKNFVIEKKLKLTELYIMTEYEGYDFDMLPGNLQRRIKETDIVIHQIRQGTPAVVRYEIFNRINKYGTPLSAQEIRHAIYPGSFWDFIAKLAGCQEFKDATDNGVSPQRMGDQECVLRFMAFNFLPPEEYNINKSDIFLNQATIIGHKLSEQKKNEYAVRFRLAMEVSRKIFREKAFRKFYRGNSGRSPVNKSLFDATSVNIANLSIKNQEILIKKRSQVVEKMRVLLAQDQEFDSAISGGTWSSRKVHYRFGAIKKIFAEVLNA